MNLQYPYFRAIRVSNERGRQENKLRVPQQALQNSHEKTVSK